MRTDNRRILRGEAPTLRSVAQAAGVSKTIVSRVANGTYTGMTPETRARVERAIKTLGYRRNRAAASLRTSRQYRASLIVVDTSPAFLADPFTTYIAAGLANALSEADYGLLVQRIDPRTCYQNQLHRAKDGDALTLLLSGPRERRLMLLEQCRELGLPLLVFQEALDASPGDVCVIRQDDRRGACWLGVRMRTAGIEDVLAVVPQLSWAASEERVRGLTEGLGRNARVRELAVDETDPVAVAAALDAEFTRGVPQGVFGNNDQLAAHAIAALGRRGLRVPRDVGVAGFNALPVTGHVEPPLTTVRAAAFRMGEEAARLLLRRLDADAFDVREAVLPVEPVEGMSL